MRQEDEPFYRFHVEHVIAKQHEGADELSNLALACHYCNLHKGPNLSAIDPETGRLVALFNPRLQAWDEHFDSIAGRVLGKTEIARATVRLLNMNDAVRVLLRAPHDHG
jgi:hypothetical protein